MKKSFLILAATAMMLAGCGPKGGKGGSTEVPTEEGKTTFYFTVAEDSVALPAHASYFLTGGFTCEDGSTDWLTDADKVVEFKQLKEGSNVYYGMFDKLEVGSTKEKYYNYQLTVGYNAESGAPSTGVNWSYKSAECAAFEYGTDPVFEIAADGTVNLGTHTWTEMPAAPKILHNLTINVTFAEAVPANVALYMPGNFKNNWACSPAEDALTPSADRKTWSIVVPQVVAGNKEAKIIAEYATATAYTWANTVLDNGEGGNYALMLKGTWGDDYVLNLNEQIDEETAAPLSYDFAAKLPEVLAEKVDVKIKLVADAAITAEKLYVAGTMNSWTATEMTKVDDTHFEYTIAETNIPSYEFGILADTGWHLAVKLADEGNTKAKVSVDNHEIVLELAEGGAAFLNQAIDEAQWLTFNKGTVTDSEGTRSYPSPVAYENSIKKAYEAAAGDVVTVKGIIKGSYDGTPKVDGAYTTLTEYYNGMFIADEDAGIFIYNDGGVTLPAGAGIDSKVEITGAISIYKGLVQIKNPTEIKVIEDDHNYAGETPVLTANPTLADMSRLVKISGEVTALKNTFADAKTGSKDVTVTVKVSDTFSMNVFFKRAGGFNFDVLAEKCVVGAQVTVEGYVAIYDGNATVDYATTTGWQLVMPAVTFAA